MDDFAHEEEVVLFGIHRAAQKLHEPRGQKIAHVQPEPVDLKFADPEAHGVHEVILKVLIFEAEFDELGMAFPIFVVEPVVIARIAPEVDVEPEAVVGALALFEDFLKGREGAADVVEHAV